jgi:hypothetical protein
MIESLTNAEEIITDAKKGKVDFKVDTGANL